MTASATASRDDRRAGPVRFELQGGALGIVESAPVVPLVSIVISMRSGAIADPEGRDGLCRFAGRLLRRGCKGLSSPEIETSIDRLGAELGLDVGPSTMTLHGQVIRRNLRPFCELLARLLGTPTFDQEELARLRRESVAEIVEARDSDRSLASVALRRALFAGHPYSRSAAGRCSTVETFTRDEAVAAYEKHFVRKDLVIGFAGAITEAEAKELGELLVSAMREGPSVTMTIPDPAPPEGRRLVFVDKPERTQTQLLIGALGTWPHDPDHFPLITATAIFGGTFTSRMMREIRSKRGWSYGTSARLSIERKRHAFTMSAAPAAADCPPCLALELDMLEAFVAKGVTERELSFIKNYLVRSHAFEVDTAPKRLGQALEAELLQLGPDYHAAFLEHVRGVKPEDANAAVAQRLHPANLYVVVVGTASELLDKVTASIPRLAGQDVVPFDRD